MGFQEESIQVTIVPLNKEGDRAAQGDTFSERLLL